MQNVLFFIFRLHGGGAERVVSNLSKGLAGRYNIKIAVFDKSEETYPFNGELIRIKLPFSKDTEGNKWWARALRLLMLVYELRKIKKQHKIDVVVSFAEQANIINVLTKGRIKTVLSVRTFLSKHILDASNPDVLRFFVLFLYNRADLIVVPSEVTGLDLIKHFRVVPQKLQVIYNYTDRGRITELSHEKLSSIFYDELFELPVLLNVGRITQAKGQWLLLELMKRIKADLPDWKLVIIGEAENGGFVKNELIVLAGRLGLKLYDSSSKQSRSLDYDVYLLGFQKNPFCFMSKSKMLLFPSVFEGFPNTLLEAMQCGLPVISSDCEAGPREILAPGSDLESKATKMELTKYGILCPALASADIKTVVPPAIIDEWVNAVTTMVNSDSLRSSFIQNGYCRVKDFDQESILAQWEKTFLAG